MEGAFTPGGFGPAQSGAHVGSGEGLRPLRVGEVLDAAIKLYRRNAVDLWKIVACVVVPVLLIRRQQRRAIVDRLARAQRQQSGPEAQADRVAERAAGLGGCCVALERLRGVSGCQVGAGAGLERGVEAAHAPADPEDRERRRFVRAGGVLIAGGREPEAWLDELLAAAPSWTDIGETAPSTHLPVPQTAGVGVVETAGTG